jgi:hypothetical protein
MVAEASAALGDGGVDRAEEPARDAPGQPDADEARILREAAPALERDRVRHPRIAPLGVVLDDDEAAAGAEVAGERGEDLELALGGDEVERGRGRGRARR